jgi:hypothetical protein
MAFPASMVYIPAERGLKKPLGILLGRAVRKKKLVHVWIPDFIKNLSEAKTDGKI